MIKVPHTAFMRLIVALLTVGGACVPVADAAGFTSAQREVGEFHESACPYADQIVTEFGASLSCGVLTAPLQHGVDDGLSVRLSVARIAGRSAASDAVPLVMLLGGPGQEVESVLPFFAALGDQTYRPLLDRQDVILVDQRGVGYSEPSLACPFDIVGGVLVPGQELDADNPVPGFGACADDLLKQGVSLEAFDSVQSAADVDLLRRALGYEQVDLLGTSYGSRLALTVLRDFPGAVRVAVLESPMPLQANLVAGQIIGFDRALNRIFAQCDNDDACRSRYPDLHGTFSAAVDALNAEPLTLQVTHPATGVADTVDIDGTSFTSIVYFATYTAPLLPFVPALIDGIRSGENVVLENIAPYTIGLSAGVSLGASYVINCNDEIGLTTAEEVRSLVDAASVRPQLANGRFAGAFRVFDICAEFGVEPADLTEEKPVQSDVPVLVLAGEFDPITPPSYADLALEGLPNGVGVTFANGSHAPLSTSGDCGFAIVDAFLGSPGSTVDATCASEATVDFLILRQ